MRRILSLWLPTFATDVQLSEQTSNFCNQPGRIAALGQQTAPVKALIDSRGSTILVHAITDGARALGLTPGMSLSDARAMYPGVITADVNAEQLHAATRWLARWLDRYSPLIAPTTPLLADASINHGGNQTGFTEMTSDPTSTSGDALLRVQGMTLGGDAGFWIDITGVSHLFGGEADLMRSLLGNLRKLGLNARAAIADSPGCAWAVCRFASDRQPRIIPNGAQAQSLARLPLAGLRLDAKTVEALARVGLTRIEQLATLSRASLSRRFGPAVLFRLDQAYGRAQEALSPLKPLESYERRVHFNEPATTEVTLKTALNEALIPLLRTLEEKNMGARCIRLQLHRADGSAKTLEVRTHAPTRSAIAIKRLFADRWSEIDPGFGIDVLALSVPSVQQLHRLQSNLLTAGGVPTAPGEIFTDGQKRGAKAARKAIRAMTATPAPALLPLFDNISNRLGLRAVHRLTAKERHGPEAAFSANSPTVQQVKAAPRPGGDAALPRPIKLLTQPEPVEVTDSVLQIENDNRRSELRAFKWRRVNHQVTRIDGPERISPDWWRQPVISDDRRTTPQERDYYRVQDDKGHQYWLFEAPEPSGQNSRSTWYVHGQLL